MLCRPALDRLATVILCFASSTTASRAAPQAPVSAPSRTAQPPSIQQTIDRGVADMMKTPDMTVSTPNALDYGNIQHQITNGAVIYNGDSSYPEATQEQFNKAVEEAAKAKASAGNKIIGGPDALNDGDLLPPGQIELPHLTIPPSADTAVSTDGLSSLQFLQIYGNSKLSTYRAPSSAGTSPSSLGRSPSAAGRSPSSVGNSLSSAGRSPSSTGNSLSSAGRSPSSVGNSLSSAGNSLSSVGNSLSSAGRSPSSVGTGPSSAGTEGYDPNTGDFFPNPEGRPAPANAGGSASLCGR